MKRRILFVVASIGSLISIAILQGCSAFADWQVQGCFEQADCAVDRYCDEGVCVERGDGRRTVLIESTQASVGATPSQIAEPAPVALSTLGPTRITLQEGIDVRGDMKVPNGPTPSGRLELTKQTPDPNLAIPGADANVIEAYVNDGSFNFRALSGVYQATFIPDSVDGIGKPSQTYRDIEITEENANLEFGYPSDAEFSLLEGRIAPANASLSDFENGTIRFSIPSTEIAPPQSSLG